MAVYASKVKELLKEGKTKSETIRLILNEFGGNPTTITRRVNRISSDMKNSGVFDECERVGIDPATVKHYWYKGKNYSINASSPKISYEEVRDEIIQSMNEHSPKYETIKREKCKDGHLIVIDPADIHIGKLGLQEETGDEYNNSIAINRVLDGVVGVISKSSGFNIDKIVFVAGNDILHTDNPKRTTTNGTPQDTDGMWYNNFMIAKHLYIKVIEYLKNFADVHFVFNPSNHDYTSGFFLADVIASWFRNSKNVTFDTSISHRKYFVYHDNLIGTTHGDGAKDSDLPLLMAHEAPNEWAATTKRYIYTHHVHHKTSKDYAGVTIESARSASGTDSWHHRNGYTGAKKAIEAFIHSKKDGQVARITHNF